MEKLKKYVRSMLILIAVLIVGGTVTVYFNPDIYFVSPFGPVDFSYSSMIKPPTDPLPDVVDSHVSGGPNPTQPTGSALSTTPDRSGSTDGEVVTPSLKDPITLHLSNGGTVTGEFIRETPDEIVLGWDYGEVGFARDEIVRVIRGVQPVGNELITLPWQEEKRKATRIRDRKRAGSLLDQSTPTFPL